MGTADIFLDRFLPEVDERERIEIHLLLEGIYQYYGHDFRGYSPSSVRRRLWNRVRAERLPNISALLAKLLHEPECMDRLLSDLLIPVTEMFRDPLFFLAFRRKVLPQLARMPSLRIWHAGCSSGEEVISLAILLQEADLLKNTRIYATDANEQIIQKAKAGYYPLNVMQAYTKNYQLAGGKRSFSEYYSVGPRGVQFDPLLIQNVVFAPHNLVTDTSFNEFHVIICRNVLIYFSRALQQHVQTLFFESLCPQGFLWLGSREGVTSVQYADRYEEVDKDARILRKL